MANGTTTRRKFSAAAVTLLLPGCSMLNQSGRTNYEIINKEVSVLRRVCAGGGNDATIEFVDATSLEITGVIRSQNVRDEIRLSLYDTAPDSGRGSDDVILRIGTTESMESKESKPQDCTGEIEYAVFLELNRAPDVVSVYHYNRGEALGRAGKRSKPERNQTV